MTDDKKVKGPFHVEVSTPGGKKYSNEFIDVSTAVIATDSTASIGIIISPKQYDALVRRINMLEDFAQKQEPEEVIITDSIGAEINIPGLAKFYVKREIRKKKKK